MTKRTKKVILFIVEGPTDEDTLSPVLKKIFQNDEIHFHVVYGDITAKEEITGTNALKTINTLIKTELERYGFHKTDILKVIHLIDTDGAFIPAGHVMAGNIDRIKYEETQIISPNPQSIIARNLKKTSVVKRLYLVGKISSFPYEAYYFSRNMEHVLHNISGDLTDDEKINYADDFADEYANNSEAFIQLLSNSDFTVPGNYGESWEFIFSEVNSLGRNCNLHILFQDACN